MFLEYDPPALRAREAADLFARTKDLALSYGMPIPLKVIRINDRSAELLVPRPIGKQDLYFASTWQSVFADHHGWRTVCVTMYVRWPAGPRWKSGGIKQQFSGGWI